MDKGQVVESLACYKEIGGLFPEAMGEVLGSLSRYAF